MAPGDRARAAGNRARERGQALGAKVRSQHEDFWRKLNDRFDQLRDEVSISMGEIVEDGGANGVKVKFDDEDMPRSVGLSRKQGQRYRRGDRVAMGRTRSGDHVVLGSFGMGDQRRVHGKDDVEEGSVPITAFDTATKKLVQDAVQPGQVDGSISNQNPVMTVSTLTGMTKGDPTKKKLLTEEEICGNNPSGSCLVKGSQLPNEPDLSKYLTSNNVLNQCLSTAKGDQQAAKKSDIPKLQCESFTSGDLKGALKSCKLI